jgi:hypothetical protein
MSADSSMAAERECRKCGHMTPWETLSALGAQCRHCYAAWCSEGHRYPDAAPAAVDSGHEWTRWARRLRWRSQNGQAITAAQAEAYRYALRQDQDTAAMEGRNA